MKTNPNSAAPEPTGTTADGKSLRPGQKSHSWGTIAFVSRAKGPLALLRRARSITDHYSLTPARMDRALRLFVRIIRQFDCGASLALTAVVLKRNPAAIANYLGRNIEFLVHGYTHVDYAQLPPEEQAAHLRRACQIFAAAGLPVSGFRSPYLRRGSNLDAAIGEAGFSYVSNQPVWWDVLDADALAPVAHANYERAIAFYEPWLAAERPSLPVLRDPLVEVPVSLPDDEILVDRLGASSDQIGRVWRAILSETHRWGELFTLQLHPERVAWCMDALAALLSEARAYTPPVWIARLDEIAAWWRARAAATVEVKEINGDLWRLRITGPPGATLLARGVVVVGPTEPGADGYRRFVGAACIIRAARRPFVGLSPACPPALAHFLRQQGYLIEVSDEGRPYALYLDQPDFDERSLLADIEGSAGPLVRLGRWPDGAQSALCISGDIDALTLWDYGLRLFGK